MFVAKIYKYFLASCFLTAIVSGETTSEPIFERVIETKSELAVDDDYVFEVNNLVGSLILELNEEKKIESLVTIRAFSKEEKRAQELAEKLRVELTGTAQKVHLIANYPVTEHSIYYYPNLAKLHNRKNSFKNRTRVVFQEKEVTILGDATPTAVQLLVDMHLKVPATKNGKIIVKNCIGQTRVFGVVGNLELEGILATINVQQGSGSLAILNSAGLIEVATRSGHTECTNGSGKIELVDCTGTCHLEDGSGAINCKNCDFDTMMVKTGSGSVELDQSSGNLNLLSGSGKVHLDDFISKQELCIHTGSAAVRCKGDFSALTRLAIETGSGNITFSSTPFSQLAFELTSGSGQINGNIPGMKKKYHGAKVLLTAALENTIGQGIIRTGSGTVRLETSKKKEKQMDIGKRKTK